MSDKREILFRGKENPSGNWIEGFLVGNCHIGDWVSCTPVHSKTVGQFTGLTDKNGKKIFEGDILEYVSDMICLGSGYKTGAVEVSCRVVEWGEYGWIYKEIYNNRWNSSWNNYGRKDHLYKKTAKEFVTVVGNIHDKPELLEEGTNV